MYNKLIEFNIESSFGCFNKPFSNKGGLLSYNIPPKTSIIGMVCSILGIEFDDYIEKDDVRVYAIEKFYDIKVSVQMMSKVRSSRIIFNNTSDGDIANIHQDLLIKPKYKIFISFPDTLVEYEKDFINKLKKHETVYNLYMGRNEFPISYEFISEYPIESKEYTCDDSNKLRNLKVIGILKRSKIDNLKIETTNEDDDEEFDFFNFSDNTVTLNNNMEYLLREYPIKRSNFTNFSYEFISYYQDTEDLSSYFCNIELKNNETITLTKIYLDNKVGEERWIQMI